LWHFVKGGDHGSLLGPSPTSSVGLSGPHVV
jgi:hypothetical protein